MNHNFNEFAIRHIMYSKRAKLLYCFINYKFNIITNKHKANMQNRKENNHPH